MTEIERINQNTNGEIPSEKYDIIRVKNITNAEEELNTFKQSIVTFLNNKDLDSDDEKWKEILPEKLVKFTNQLVELDFRTDDLLIFIPSMIWDLQNVKDWEWYSSKVTDDGFEINMTGIFRVIFLPLMHQQGIPHSSMFIVREDKEYPTRALTDVLTYRKWDPETMVLSPGEPD